MLPGIPNGIGISGAMDAVTGHGAAMPLPLPPKKGSTSNLPWNRWEKRKIFVSGHFAHPLDLWYYLVSRNPPMTDAFNTSLDAYEAELNRIEPLDLPGLREYIQEHPGCDWEDACDWHEQITGRSVPEEQYGEIEAVWEEESQNWEPTDDEMLGAFGTPWHDGI